MPLSERRRRALEEAERAELAPYREAARRAARTAQTGEAARALLAEAGPAIGPLVADLAAAVTNDAYVSAGDYSPQARALVAAQRDAARRAVLDDVDELRRGA